jgi:energy-coupling factor transporter ATP-binding protein EcfA2
MLEIRSVTQRYGSQAALDGISLSVAEGAYLSLLGPSRSGKSTLLRVLAGFETPDEGQVTLDGGRVLQVDTPDIVYNKPNSSAVARVLNRYTLFSDRTDDRSGIATAAGTIPAPPGADDRRQVADRVDFCIRIDKIRVRLWFITSALIFVIGYPVAVYIGLFVRDKTVQTSLLVLCVVPFWTSFLIGVLTTLFSFALLAVYATLMTLSARRSRRVAV